VPRTYFGAGIFPANGTFGFRWPTQMPDAPMRIRSVSLWGRGNSGEALPSASVQYIDGGNVVLRGPADQPFRVAIVLSDAREGDWGTQLSLTAPLSKRGRPNNLLQLTGPPFRLSGIHGCPDRPAAELWR